MEQKKESKPKPIKRFVVYVPEEEHRLFRSAVALDGMTISDWFREKIAEKIKNSKIH